MKNSNINNSNEDCFLHKWERPFEKHKIILTKDDLNKSKIVDLERVHKVVCYYFKVDNNLVFKRNGTRKDTYIKQIFQYISLKVATGKVGVSSIARYGSEQIKPYSHSTIIFSKKQIEGYLTFDKEVVEDVLNILDILPKTHKVKKHILLINKL